MIAPFVSAAGTKVEAADWKVTKRASSLIALGPAIVLAPFPCVPSDALLTIAVVLARRRE